MELDDVRIFVEIADAGGVTLGARRLGLSKSVVSRRLARLEEALGAQLLSRNTRGSTLTEAGAAFRESATRVVAEIESARETLSTQGEIRGMLRVSAPLSFGIARLSSIFAELALRHPLLHVDTSYSDHFVNLVSEGFDCAIRIGLFLPDSSLLARRICTFDGLLVASPGYLASHGEPHTIQELAQHQGVIRKGESWRFRHMGKLVSIGPHSRFTTDNGEAIVSGVLAGLGVAALPRFLISEHLAAGRLVPVLPEHVPEKAGLFIVRPPSVFSSRKLEALTDIFIEKLGRFDGSVMPE